jgi:hypothetical protein
VRIAIPVEGEILLSEWRTKLDHEIETTPRTRFPESRGQVLPMPLFSVRYQLFLKGRLERGSSAWTSEIRGVLSRSLGPMMQVRRMWTAVSFLRPTEARCG